jgi:hypothetical protein
MKSAILEKGERSFTHIGKVFQGIDNEQIKYNWLITDCNCSPKNRDFAKLFKREFVWLSGEELTEIVSKEDFQFNWGVFSGFSKDIDIKEILKYELPFAEGNSGLWLNNVRIQHPLAKNEIVAWDSSLTLFLSDNDDLVDKFMLSFPKSQNLVEKNKLFNF